MGETTQGRTGKWAKRPGGETTRGERDSGRNDSGANGKVGETTRIQIWFFNKIIMDGQKVVGHRHQKADLHIKNRLYDGDDKQPEWLQTRDQDKGSETRSNRELKVHTFNIQNLRVF